MLWSWLVPEMPFASLALIWNNKIEIHMWVDRFNFEETIVGAWFIDVIDCEGDPAKNANSSFFKLIQGAAGFVISKLDFDCLFLNFFLFFLQFLLEMFHKFTYSFIHEFIILFVLWKGVDPLIGFNNLSLQLKLLFWCVFPLCMDCGEGLKFPEFRIKCLIGK